MLDVPCINNDVSTDLEIEFAERSKPITGLHFERNDWTITLAGDERNSAFETIWQGEAIFFYQLTTQDQAVRRGSALQLFSECPVGLDSQ